MKCEVLPIDLKLKREFIVAGGRASVKRNYIFRIEDIGLGEAAGSVYYGATSNEIEADLKKAAERLRQYEAANLAEVGKIPWNDICAPALCAISTACHDYLSKCAGVPMYEHLKLARPQAKPTSVTVSIGDMPALTEHLEKGARHVKIKMNADDTRNSALIEAIDRSEGTYFRIDANGSWTYDDAIRFVSSPAADKLELIEQPFPAEAVDDWVSFRKVSDIPLLMDETVVSADDVKRVAGFVDGVNIKIQKSGNLETAIGAMTTARSMGLKVMLGCMIESSVGIAAAWQLSGAADYIDLDGRLLIDSDPFSGLIYENSIINVHGVNGHGVTFA